MKEVIEHLERMAETLDGVDEENWLDTPQDISQIYRSVANEIRQKMSAQNQSVTNCNQLKMREALKSIIKDGVSKYLAKEINDVMLCRRIENIVKEAISHPPRNCDLLANEQEALASIHNDRCCVQNPIDERKLTVKWLFAEAKGKAK